MGAGTNQLPGGVVRHDAEAMASPEVSLLRCSACGHLVPRGSLTTNVAALLERADEAEANERAIREEHGKLLTRVQELTTELHAVRAGRRRFGS